MTLFQNKLFIVFGLCVMLFAVYSWGVEPLELRRDSLVAKLKTDQERLGRIYDMKRELSGLREVDPASSSFGQLPNGVTLFGFLEETARETGIYESLESIRPSEKHLDNGVVESVVTLQIRHISLRKMVEFVFKAEASETGIRIDRLAVRVDRRVPDTLDVDLTASVYSR